MELTNVSCNKCGASLQVSDTANFVTCRYCGTQLEIKRNESTISTEVLNRIDQRTASMAEDLGAIRRETEIERLDREWALRRDSLMVTSKRGARSVPSAGSGVAGAVIMGGFGLFWTIFAFGITAKMTGSGAPGFVMIFPLFGILFIIGAVVMGIKTASAAQSYSDEESEYQRKRQQLLSASSDPQQQPLTPAEPPSSQSATSTL